ncbi:MAG: YdbL family protein [Marivibrio sp.]|uniref:YdbL family protein n=1 Tax=Marivibrio sp. TaxID=2039719 RepID=UPI0032ED18D1
MSKPSRFSSRRVFNARRGLLAALLAAPVLALPVLALIGAAPAAASPLDGPRDAGVVGERYDGLAVVRDEGRADAQVRGLVADINRQRRAYYEEQAAAQNAPVPAIAAIYAETIFEKAPSGWWFLRQDGRWVQK